MACATPSIHANAAGSQDLRSYAVKSKEIPTVTTSETAEATSLPLPTMPVEPARRDVNGVDLVVADETTLDRDLIATLARLPTGAQPGEHITASELARWPMRAGNRHAITNGVLRVSTTPRGFRQLAAMVVAANLYRWD